MAVDFTKIYKIGGLLLDCACAKLSLTEAGCPDRKCLVPGTEPEAVNCCPSGGQLTVNFVRAYPSKEFPIPDLGSNNCDAPYSVVTYLISVFRCMPVGDTQKAPSCDALDNAAYTTMVDVEAVRIGVTCCMKDRATVNALIGEGYKWVLGDHVSIEADGGCVGTELLVQVGIPLCWEC